VNEALRFPQQVHQPEFPVRMLRDVVTSPDGSMVVYSALGRLYAKRLPGGEPARLTSDERIEFSPAFSPDGAWIAYATWSDSDKGRIRIMRANGSEARDVVSTPGHYTRPSFSPDGQWLVFRSTRGDSIRGLTYAERTGLFIVPVAGSSDELRRVRDDGDAPRFDHTGDRIYFSETRNEKLVLASVDRSGGDEIVHLQSANATQIVPSPDGRWVAFAERYRTYIGAFPRSGRAIDIGPDVRQFPVARVSSNEGMSIHWSGDSRRLYWTLGPELFTRDLTRTFTFVEQGADKAAEPEATGIPIGFTLRSDVPSGAIAFVGARVITIGPGKPFLDNATVVVEGNRITAVGPSGSVRIPAGAARIDVKGKTIMAGMVDVHAHVDSESDGILAEASWSLMANLAYGVTTSHDPSAPTATIFTNEV